MFTYKNFNGKTSQLYERNKIMNHNKSSQAAKGFYNKSKTEDFSSKSKSARKEATGNQGASYGTSDIFSEFSDRSKRLDSGIKTFVSKSPFLVLAGAMLAGFIAARLVSKSSFQFGSKSKA